MSIRSAKLCLLLSLITVLSACGTQVKLYDENNQPTLTDPALTPRNQNSGINTPQIDVSSQSNQEKVIPELNNNLVFFDFDSYVVKEEFYPLITLHANYLLNHKEQNVFLEGHTDAAGSSEYNIALGQRRSEAIRKMLMTLGVPEDRIEAISFGKEKPLVEGYSSEAMAKNRRAQFSYRP